MSFSPDYKSELVLTNPVYKNFIHSLFEIFLVSDSYQSNVSNNFLSGNSYAIVRANSKGMLACSDELQYMVEQFSNSTVTFAISDGTVFEPEDEICTLEGPSSELLSLERVFLNFLSRACGIALKASDYAKLISKSKVLMTRKCLLGLFDKKAASVAGVLTHRLSLNDALMIKDNHHEIFDLENLTLPDHVKFIEVEVDNESLLSRTLKYLRNCDSVVPKIVLLDNFAPENIRTLLAKYDFQDLYVEVSGGIKLSNIKNFEIDRVDFISTSDISTSPYAIDLSLNLESR